jgi:rhodanese-related sulfurtransferase
MQALDGRSELVARVERITAATLAEQLGEADAPLLVDVRSEHEWDEGRIEGSVNVPLGRLPDRLSELPRDRPLVVYCSSGYRSSIAASIMLRRGFAGIADLVGGLDAWHASTAGTAA